MDPLGPVAGTLAVFVLFHIFVFTKMVGRHAQRIRGYEEDRTHVLKFFDKKGYVVMAVMMGGGMALRASASSRSGFVAFFYTGLGLALAVAGASFMQRYFRSAKAPCPALPKTYAPSQGSLAARATKRLRLARASRALLYHGRRRRFKTRGPSVRRRDEERDAHGTDIRSSRTTRRCAARLCGCWSFTAMKAVQSAHRLRRAADEALAAAPDCVLLDLRLPGTDGHAVCRDIRRERRCAPSSCSRQSDSEFDEVMGMNLGADDYVTKPCTTPPCSWRAPLLGAAPGAAAGPGRAPSRTRASCSTWRAAPWSTRGRSAELTRNEIKILHMLMANRGAIVSRQELMVELWNSDAFIDDNTLTVNVNRLRASLASIGVPEGFVAHAARAGLSGVAPCGRAPYLRDRAFSVAMWLTAALAAGGVLAVLGQGVQAAARWPQAPSASAARRRFRTAICAAGASTARPRARRLRPGPRLAHGGAARRARFLEGRLAWEALEAAGRAAGDEVAARKRQAEAYREYIDLWIHEIKTPIAAAKLMASDLHGPQAAKLKGELDRIEDYVEQVL